MTKRIALAPSVLVIALLLIEAELISGPLRSGAVQAALALPLALYLPGAVLRRALTRQADDGLADHILISLGLSLAVLAVGGVVLNLLAVGLRPLTWLVYIALVLFVGEFVTQMRGEGGAAVGAFRTPRVQPRQLTLVITIIGLLGAATAVSIVGAHRQRFPGFAQFWLVPQGRGTSYELGVASYTGRLDTYAVNLNAGRRSLRRWHITLSSGQRWSAVVRLPASVSVTAVLFRNGATTAYRQVSVRHTPA